MVWTLFVSLGQGFHQKGNEVRTGRQYANGSVAVQGLGLLLPESPLIFRFQGLV